MGKMLASGMTTSKHHMWEVPQYLPLSGLVFSGSMSELVWYSFPLQGSPAGQYHEDPYCCCLPWLLWAKSITVINLPKPFNITLQAFVPADSVCLGLPVQLWVGTVSHSFNNPSSTGLLCNKENTEVRSKKELDGERKLSSEQND